MVKVKSGTIPTSGLLALLLVAPSAAQKPPANPGSGAAEAVTAPVAPPASSSESTPASSMKISYADGQLKIDVVNSTLAGVLAKIVALTGVKIDVPAAASVERLPVVNLGPGPARQVIASLLSASEFDYLIAA